MLLLTLPYVVLAWLAPRGTTYTGVIFNPNDTFLYYAQMAHAQHSAWLFRDYFTYLPSQSLLAYALYSALGHAAPVAKGTSGLTLGFHLDGWCWRHSSSVRHGCTLGRANSATLGLTPRQWDS